MASYSAGTGTAKVETRTWVLQAETELRFDVSAEHTLTVVVSLGSVAARRFWLSGATYRVWEDSLLRARREYHAVILQRIALPNQGGGARDVSKRASILFYVSHLGAPKPRSERK